MNDLWIFDLDGTLWEENSHVSIVENYVGWKKYTNIVARIYGHFFFDSYMKYLNRDYKHIPCSDIKKFKPHIRQAAIDLLNDAITNNNHAVILTNAPENIVRFARQYFNVEAYHAEIGKKVERLKLMDKGWKDIFVVTDNLSDIDLISVSTQTYFIIQKNKRRVYQKLKNYSDKVVYMEVRGGGN